MKTLKEIHTKWIEDLRSGEYGQALGALCYVPKDDEGFEIEDQPRGYCCLGVLAVTNGYNENYLLDDGIPSVNHFDDEDNLAIEYVKKLENNGLICILPLLNDGTQRFNKRYDEYDEYDYENMRIKKVQSEDGIIGHQYDKHTFLEIADFLERNTDVIFSE